MRRTALLGTALLLSASLASADDRREAIERDLVLEVVLKSEGAVEAGAPLLVDLRIVNRSKATHRVVAADGSLCGFPGTEPHLWFSAEVDPGDGRFREVERLPLGMCGMGDYAWHRHVRTLAPGESVTLGQLTAVNVFLDLQTAGRLRLKGHYRYARGTEATLPGAERDAGPMGDVPTFELASAPVEVVVTRPIDVRLERIGNLAPGRRTAVADLFAAVLENRSGRPLEAPPGGWRTYVMWRTAEGHPVLEQDPGTAPEARLALPSGSTLTLIGESGVIREHVKLAERPEGALEAAVVLEVTSGTVRRVRSAWVRVPVD